MASTNFESGLLQKCQALAICFEYVLVTSFQYCDNKTQDFTNLRTLEEAKEEDEEASIAL